MPRTRVFRAAAAPENAAGRGYRTVPLYTIRKLAQDETDRTSIRRVAKDAGLRKSTLHNFVAGKTIPHPRVRRLLALWYLRRRDELAEEEAVRPYVEALGMVIAGMPDEVQAGTSGWVLDILEHYATMSGGRTRMLCVLRGRCAVCPPAAEIEPLAGACFKRNP
jgi:AcrR family transcriptional regulator